MIEFAYTLDGDTSMVQDFNAAVAGNTNATKTSATAGAYTPKPGDIVTLNDQGNAALALEATVTGKQYLNATTVLGLCEGGNFRGITEGGTYAAVTVTNNSESNTLAKVHVTPTEVYRIDMVPGESAPVTGKSYSVLLDATHGAQLDTSDPVGTTQIAEVVGFDADANVAFIRFTTRDLGN